MENAILFKGLGLQMQICEVVFYGKNLSVKRLIENQYWSSLERSEPMRVTINN